MRIWFDLVEIPQRTQPFGRERQNHATSTLRSSHSRNGRLEAATSHIIGVEVEAASTELEQVQHVCCSSFVIVIEEFAGLPTRSTVVETQQAAYVNECEGICLHPILGHLQFDVHVAVVLIRVSMISSSTRVTDRISSRSMESCSSDVYQKITAGLILAFSPVSCDCLASQRWENRDSR